MAFLESLLLAVGLIAKAAISQNSDVYCFGDTYTLHWDASQILSSKVSIVLKYETSIWTLATDKMNNGTAMIGASLGDSAQQLFIPNNTEGEFLVFGNSTNQVVSAANVTLCQSIIFSTPGRAVAARHDIRNVIVNLRRSTYSQMGGFKKAKFTAAFVSVDEDGMKWTERDGLEIVSSTPTNQPTVAPTTVAPTTAQPTSVSVNDNDANKATTFFSTETPKENGMRLAQALAAYQVSLGVEDSNNVEIGLPDCENGNSTQGWCQANLTIRVPFDTEAGGPYELLIGITENTTLPWQYYGVNMDEDYVTQFLAYNESEVDITLTLASGHDTNPNSTIYKYEAAGLQVSLGDKFDKNISVFVGASKPFGFSEEVFLLECGKSHVASFYSAFGWKTWDYNDFQREKGRWYLPSGPYSFVLYWAPNGDDYNGIINNEYFEISSPNIQEFHVMDDVNGTLSPVSITTKKYSHGENEVEFTTSFNKGTYFEGVMVQCNTTCETVANSTFNFTSKGINEKSKVKMNFPDSLFYTSLPENENDTVVTYFNISTLFCDNETELRTTVYLSIGKTSKSKSKGLSAGAIVGIVCSGVLVLGLAAWWLCMKKGGGDGYRELNE